jgi:hypothetical protein
LVAVAVPQQCRQPSDDALHGQRRLREAFLYAFDLIEMDSERKTRVWSGCWPAGTPASCSTSTSWKKGAVVFAAACGMGLEGIVSKRLDAPYRSGRLRDWIKTKNPASPAMLRAREGRAHAGASRCRIPLRASRCDRSRRRGGSADAASAWAWDRGSQTARADAVAGVASRLFGQQIRNPTWTFVE